MAPHVAKMWLDDASQKMILVGGNGQNCVPAATLDFLHVPPNFVQFCDSDDAPMV